MDEMTASIIPFSFLCFFIIFASAVSAVSADPGHSEYEDKSREARKQKREVIKQKQKQIEMEKLCKHLSDIYRQFSEL